MRVLNKCFCGPRNYKHIYVGVRLPASVWFMCTLAYSTYYCVALNWQVALKFVGICVQATATVVAHLMRWWTKLKTMLCMCTYTREQIHEQQTLFDAQFSWSVLVVVVIGFVCKKQISSACRFGTRIIYIWIFDCKQRNKRYTFTFTSTIARINTRTTFLFWDVCKFTFRKLKFGQNLHCQYQSMLVVNVKFDVNWRHRYCKNYGRPYRLYAMQKKWFFRLNYFRMCKCR